MKQGARFMRIWVKGVRVTLKISAVNAFRGSSRELAKSQDESQNTLTLQLPTCAPHVTFAGCTTREPSREINFLSNFHHLRLNSLQLNSTKYKKIN